MQPVWDDLYPRRSSFKGRRDLMRPPSLYPQRVPPHLIMQQQHNSPPTSRGTPAASSRLREEEHTPSPAAPSDDSLSLDESSSDIYDCGKEVRNLTYNSCKT